MDVFAALRPIDWIALSIFFIGWVAYEPAIKRAGRPGGVINTDMMVIRLAWMKRAVRRETPLVDGQIVGHVLNSASFFASSNLLLIAGAVGALFNADDAFRSASALIAIKTSSRALFEVQIGLVVVTLARGFLAFIWSIRQLNYCLAAIGASAGRPDRQDEFARGLSSLLNPALSAFNSGVRGYYFAMAAAAWLFGAPAMMAATVGAIALLYFRQRGSRTAAAVHNLRKMLEEDEL